MDNIRHYLDRLSGNGPDDDTPAVAPPFADMAEEDIGEEVLPTGIGQDDRRLQVRAYTYWAGLLGAGLPGHRHFPPVTALRLDRMPDLAARAVLLDFGGNRLDPAIAWLGDALADVCRGEDRRAEKHPIRRLSDVAPDSLLARITEQYPAIIANQAPVGFEAEFVNRQGATVLYRGMLLPFSEDDRTIRHVLGVISWKEMADPGTNAALMREFDRALFDADGMAPVSPPTPPPVSRLLDEWADGPLAEPIPAADDTAHAEAIAALNHLELGAVPDAIAAHLRLADWLANARELAQAALLSEDRNRHALYAAIGRAHDFALAAARAPRELAAMIADAGLVAQTRAPLIPLVKLVFGAEHDKTRLTEYATALAHANRLGMARGMLAAYLGAAAGGLKGVVNEERRLRHAESRAESAPAPEPRILDTLRTLPVGTWADLPQGGPEFTVVVVRRMADGAVALVGDLGDDPVLLARAAHRLMP